LDSRLEILKQLKKSGRRITRQREILLDALLANRQKMLSAAELYEAVEGKRVDLATVYRTLDYFVEVGIAEAIMDKSGACRYTLRVSSHHHHLICGECGKLIDIPCPGSFWDDFCRLKGFKADTHKLEIYGVCSNCQEKD